MSVGAVTTKQTFDASSATLASQLSDWARRATNLNSVLLAMSESDLEGLGYSSADVALLKSAAGDMGKLAAIYRGEATQDPAYDFRTFTMRIAGLQIV